VTKLILWLSRCVLISLISFFFCRPTIFTLNNKYNFELLYYFCKMHLLERTLGNAKNEDKIKSNKIIRVSRKPASCHQFSSRWNKCTTVLAMREMSARPSVRPSVKRVHCDKTEESSAQIFIPYKRSFILVFLEVERLVGSTASFNTSNFGLNWPCWSEIADFQSIFVRSASSLTPRKKVQLTLIGSPLRAFQWA